MCSNLRHGFFVVDYNRVLMQTRIALDGYDILMWSMGDELNPSFQFSLGVVSVEIEIGLKVKRGPSPSKKMNSSWSSARARQAAVHGLLLSFCFVVAGYRVSQGRRLCSFFAIEEVEIVVWSAGGAASIAGQLGNGVCAARAARLN